MNILILDILDYMALNIPFTAMLSKVHRLGSVYALSLAAP